MGHIVRLDATAGRFNPARETTEARPYGLFPQVHDAYIGTGLSHPPDKVI
jgi:hypothetical protein